MRNIELKQDIHSAGVVDISSKIRFPIVSSEINIRFKPNNYWAGLAAAEKFGIRFSNQEGEFIEVGYDVYYQLFFIKRKYPSTMVISYESEIQPYIIENDKILDMKIILNAGSVELSSINNGNIAIADSFQISSEINKMELYAENGKIYVKNVSIKQLKKPL